MSGHVGNDWVAERNEKDGEREMLRVSTVELTLRIRPAIIRPI